MSKWFTYELYRLGFGTKSSAVDGYQSLEATLSLCFRTEGTTTLKTEAAGFHEEFITTLDYTMSSASLVLKPYISYLFTFSVRILEIAYLNNGHSSLCFQ